MYHTLIATSRIHTHSPRQTRWIFFLRFFSASVELKRFTLFVAYEVHTISRLKLLIRIAIYFAVFFCQLDNWKSYFCHLRIRWIDVWLWNIEYTNTYPILPSYVLFCTPPSQCEAHTNTYTHARNVTVNQLKINLPITHTQTNNKHTCVCVCSLVLHSHVLKTNILTHRAYRIEHVLIYRYVNIHSIASAFLDTHTLNTKEN